MYGGILMYCHCWFSTLIINDGRRQLLGVKPPLFIYYFVFRVTYPFVWRYCLSTTCHYLPQPATSSRFAFSLSNKNFDKCNRFVTRLFLHSNDYYTIIIITLLLYNTRSSSYDTDFVRKYRNDIRKNSQNTCKLYRVI